MKMDDDMNKVYTVNTTRYYNKSLSHDINIFKKYPDAFSELKNRVVGFIMSGDIMRDTEVFDTRVKDLVFRFIMSSDIMIDTEVFDTRVKDSVSHTLLKNERNIKKIIYSNYNLFFNYIIKESLIDISLNNILSEEHKKDLFDMLIEKKSVDDLSNFLLDNIVFTDVSNEKDVIYKYNIQVDNINFIKTIKLYEKDLN